MRSYLSVLWTLCFFGLIATNTAQAEDGVPLGVGKIVLQDVELWRPVPPEINLSSIDNVDDFESLQQAYETLPVSSSLGAESGAYLTKLVLQPSRSGRYFVVINANFIDVGIASYVQAEQQTPTFEIFSQLADDTTPHLLHFQGVEIQAQSDKPIVLWVLIAAKHFPTPVSLSIYDSAAFHKFQIYNNGLTIAATTVMSLLALLALLVFVSTRKQVALTCAGYLGLHGIGWAAASGLVDDMFNIPINSTYWGGILFPFAIACASAFVSDLFDCKANHQSLFRTLRVFRLASTAAGLTVLLLPFSIAFLISHLLAVVWVILSLTIGIAMLKLRDFRAKYFLIGNLLYSFSLIYYTAAHSQKFGDLPYSELTVVFALSVDCICILLCLAEWFKLQQIEFNRNYRMSRTDEMTQLGNRFALTECVMQLKGYYVVVYVDLDGLKTVNDRAGHQEGDRLIIETARLMQQSFSRKGNVFRSGGDEFVGILHSPSELKTEELTQFTLAQMRAISIALNNKWQGAGVSFGTATSAECSTANDCISLADKRMYQYKSINKKMA